ncbi:unnamed protein product [Cuscuta epithymum]|uniref:Protein CHROMATIN REMODELING 24 n=1 Tax=Cuscuta epithymum TaxID=186058 RepID=A0AAV0CUV9_9ASTE|nr:unnamed protein product [Cuscuta epithymum]
MADQGKKKQHLSLNQRHTRVLLDLSASHSKAPPSSCFHEGRVNFGANADMGNEKQQEAVPSFGIGLDSLSASPCTEENAIKPERKLQDKNEDVPNFGTDFVSPTISPPLEEYASTAGNKVQEKEEDVPNFGIGFDSPIPPPPPLEENSTNEEGNLQEENDNVLNSGINFDSPNGSSLPEPKEKDGKRRIKGRRRLCKIVHDININENDPVFDEGTNGLEIPDFDSSPPVRNAVVNEYSGGGNEIRDININENDPVFDEGTNGLEIPDFDSSPPVRNAAANEYSGGGNEIRDILNDLSSRLEILSIDRTKVQKKIDRTERVEEFPEYESADSSFSVSSDEEMKKKKNEVKAVAGKSECVGKSHPSYHELDDTDDDCVVVSEKKALKNFGSPNKYSAHEHCHGDEVDDRCGDGFASEEEHLFTSNGLKFMLPGEVANMLYPHQRDGLKWLWSIHSKGKGGILGDDMGLGKTMQICGFLAGLFHSNMIRRVMVVAPKTLMPHWIKELTVVGLSGKIREYYGTSIKARDYELRYILEDKGVLLTTYDIVRNNVKSLCGDYYHRGDRSEDEVIWDYMILDEGHLIKNPSTQRAKSLHEIPSAHRIIISGTPLQNNLKELWALFNFCCPGLLGDKKWFKEKYEHFILRGNEKNASDREKRISSQVAKELRECIQPYFLRRLKSDVFTDDTSTGIKLSKKSEMCVWLKLTSCQRQLYVAFLKSEIVLSACDSSPLAALTILKKICDHPLLLTKRAAEEVLEGMESISLPSQEDQAMAERLAMQMAKAAEKLDFEDSHNISCKINFIMQLLEFLIPNGHHVLIFSQTRKMLDQIQASLMSVDLKFLRIDGTTKAADRLKIVNNFQEGHGAPIFLLTSQVGGLGLTLTKADRVIVVDPAWNPSTDNQSVDRAYRIGQKKDVVVYRLMTCGTVEEKIYRKQVFKGGLFKTATEHKEQIRYFSRGDLQELFSIPKQGFDVSLTQQQLHEEHDHHHEIRKGSLKAEMEFLGAMDIGGVSQHSLLFSKTAPVPVDQDDEDVSGSARGPTYVGNVSSRSSVEPIPNEGAQFAFKPKDVKNFNRPMKASSSVPRQTEAEIRDRIKRLSHVLSEKGVKLPDKGEKLRKQIAELHSELYQIQNEGEEYKEVIDLDDLSGKFKRVINV